MVFASATLFKSTVIVRCWDVMSIGCAGTWGFLQVPDLATMVEVIEHMDSHILG